MILKSIEHLKSGYEGCEKKLEIDFAGRSIRSILKREWSRVLRVANCLILSSLWNEHLEAFILSESSLLVYPSKLILNTCGTTTLLLALPELIKLTAKNGSFVTNVRFSRSNFLFPDSQPYPHKNFDLEIKYLEKFFSGEGYVIGPLNGPRQNIYLANLAKKSFKNNQNNAENENFAKNGKNTKNGKNEKNDLGKTLELVLYDLDIYRLKKFFAKSDSNCPADFGLNGGKNATNESGISLLFPEAKIDAYLFYTCGYSCNALLGKHYFTIHVTPEPECSFVSFETNIQLKSYSNLIRNICRIFQPKMFCTFLYFSQGKTTAPQVDLPNYIQTSSLHTSIGGQFSLFHGNFHFVDFPPKTQNCLYGSKRYSENFLRSAEEENPSENRSVLHIDKKIDLVFNEKCFFDKNRFFNKNDFFNKGISTENSLQSVEKSVLSLLSGCFSVKQLHFGSKIDENCLAEFVVRRLISDYELDEGFTVLQVGQLVKLLYFWVNRYPSLCLSYNVSFYYNPLLLVVFNFFGAVFSCFRVDQAEVLLTLGIQPEKILMSNPWLSKAQIKRAADLGLNNFVFDDSNYLDKLLDETDGINGEINVSFALNSPNNFDNFRKCLSKIAEIKRFVESKIDKSSKNDLKNSFENGLNRSLNKIYENKTKICLKNVLICGSKLESIENLTFIADLVEESGLELPVGIILNSLNSKKGVLTNGFDPLFNGIFGIKNSRLKLTADISAFVAKAALIKVAKVISVRKDHIKNNEKCPFRIHYFVDDGIYENFLFHSKESIETGTVQNRQKFSKNRRQKRRKLLKTAKMDSVVWGRTCDNIDCIVKSVNLPLLDCNDWIFFRFGRDPILNDTATAFNGFSEVKNTIYVWVKNCGIKKGRFKWGK